MIEKNCQKLNEKNGVPKGKKSYTDLVCLPVPMRAYVVFFQQSLG